MSSGVALKYKMSLKGCSLDKRSSLSLNVRKKIVYNGKDFCGKKFAHTLPWPPWAKLGWLYSVAQGGHDVVSIVAGRMAEILAKKLRQSKVSFYKGKKFYNIDSRSAHLNFRNTSTFTSLKIFNGKCGKSLYR